MIDLVAIAEGVLREHLLRVAQDVVAMELMDEDPECQLLDNDDWDKVADLITHATIDVKVRVH